MPKVTYTREEKDSALLLCDQIGVMKASEQTGITTKSLYKWRAEAKEEAPAASADGADGTDGNADQENTVSVRKRYTAEEKARALRLCDEIGVTKASQEIGIHVNSLRKWRADAQTETPAPSSAEGAPQQKAVTEQTDLQKETERRGEADFCHSEAPTGEAAAEAHVAQDDCKCEMVTEELIRLRSENDALKAQVIALKGALRVFTQ